jgi:signal transduction histidine kinase
VSTAAARKVSALKVTLISGSDESVPLRPAPAASTTLSETVAAAAQHSKGVKVVEDGRYPAGAAESTVVTVHRIVHECLINVARPAGDVPAIVHLRHADSGVHDTVSNDAPATARGVVPGTGIGLVAIRERAELIGGTLHAEPTHDGGFAVHAFVPYQLPGWEA